MAAMTSQGIINMMHSFAVLHFYPPKFLEAAAATLLQLSQGPRQLSDQELSNILYSFGKLAHHPGNKLLAVLCNSIDSIVSLLVFVLLSLLCSLIGPGHLCLFSRSFLQSEALQPPQLVWLMGIPP